MTDLAALPTPCLLLDRGRLEKNCRRMRAIAAKHGVRLRPHLKTSKSIDVANVALGDSAFRAATLSTIEEAQYFAERGLTDLTYAVGSTPDKLDRVRAIQQKTGASIGVITDDLAVARVIGTTDLRAWIEIDSGHHRGGTDAESKALIEIGEALGERLMGVLTHAGHSYMARSAQARADIAEEERSAAVRAAERLRGAGIDCAEVSVGSTPTATHARHFDGCTELRPGVYVFGDLFQASIGTCAHDDIAVSVLASVIGKKEGVLWLDAGALALTQDRSLEGFGEVLALDRTPLLGAPRVDKLNQAHGRIAATASEPLDGLPIGARVRILPNHACLTAAMYDRYFVEEEGRIVAEWPRLRG